MIKTIVCTGDSHTCGQGATGFFASLDAGYNPQGKGIGRNMRFDAKGYVNLVRNYMREATGSDFSEILADSFEGDYDPRLQLLHIKAPFTFEPKARLAAFMLAEGKQAVYADIYLNGRLYASEKLYTRLPRYGELSFRLIPVFCEPSDVVEIVPRNGEILLDSVQCFFGEWAVINSGVGSCAVKRYMDEYFDYCVRAFKPEAVVAEAHTINDWLRKLSPSLYEEELRAYLRLLKETSPHVLMTTVSPIIGNTGLPYNQNDYSEFVKSSIVAARAEDVAYVDANAEMAKRIEGLETRQAAQLMFYDPWHVNDLGHQIYAELITQKLRSMLGF